MLPKTETKKQTLLDIGTDALALNSLLEEIAGDVSDPAVADAIDEWLNENDVSLEKKLDGYASLIEERTAMAKARKEKARRLTDLARTDENTVARLKERSLCVQLGLKQPSALPEDASYKTAAFRIQKVREAVTAQQALNRESIPTTPPTIHQPETTTGNSANSFQKTKAAHVAALADEYKNSGDELDETACFADGTFADDELNEGFQSAVARDSDEISEGEVIEDDTPSYGEVSDGDYQGALPAPTQGALVFEIPNGTPRAKCRSCDADVFWIQTQNNKKMPANPDGTSHFSTCPNANEHRAESDSKHLAALIIAAQNAGFTTQRETMIAAINKHMESPHFRPIQSRKQLSKLQCDLVISAIENGFLVWESADKGGAK